MAGVQSNLPEIEQTLKALSRTLAFDRPGRNQSLGRDALAVVTTAIGDRCREELAPGGSEWAKNKSWARTNKLKQGKPIGVLGDTDNMLAPEQLAGEPTITKDSAVATYGVDDACRRKAEWFSTGNANQEPRPFFEMDERTDEALEEFLDSEIERYLESL